MRVVWSFVTKMIRSFTSPLAVGEGAKETDLETIPDSEGLNRSTTSYVNYSATSIIKTVVLSRPSLQMPTPSCDRIVHNCRPDQDEEEELNSRYLAVGRTTDDASSCT